MVRRISLFSFGAFLSLFFLAYLSPENKLKNTFYAYLNYFDSDKRIVGQLVLSKEFNYLVSNENDISVFMQDCWVNHDLSDKESYPQKFVLENIMPERLEASIYYCIDESTARQVSLYLDTNNYLLNVSQKGSAEDDYFYKIDVFNKNLLNKLSDEKIQIEYNKFIKGENKYIDNINWRSGVSENIMLENGGFIIIKVHNFLKKTNWRLYCHFYDNEIIKEQGGDRIMTYTDFVKLEKHITLSSKSYKSSYIVIIIVISIMLVVIYFIRKRIIRKI